MRTISHGLTLRGELDLMTSDQGQWRSFIRTHRRQMEGTGDKDDDIELHLKQPSSEVLCIYDAL